MTRHGNADTRIVYTSGSDDYGGTSAIPHKATWLGYLPMKNCWAIFSDVCDACIRTDVLLSEFLIGHYPPVRSTMPLDARKVVQVEDITLQVIQCAKVFVGGNLTKHPPESS